jgi:hypothetical protein
MVMYWRPPPEAMRASKPSVLSSARKASKGTTYSRALVSGTSRPSSRAWMRTVFTPSALAWATIALRWSMWLCTLPSENRPMKWITPRPALAPATICCHASPAQMAPSAMALATSAAPWAYTWPAPMALWPTSELPMSSSDGMPTAVPWARSVMCGHSANSASRVGLRAAAMALPTSVLGMP